MAQVLAIKNHSYAGRKRYVGETYEANDLHVSFLQTARLANPLEDGSPVEPGEPKPKRRYRRRDIRAET